MSAVRVEEARARHLEGLLALFARASRGCFCRWWHFDGDDYAWQARCNLEPDANRELLRQRLADGHPEAAGVVALGTPATDPEGMAGKERVMGWLKLCPAEHMAKLYHRRVYRSLRCFDGDRRGVLVLGCMLVDPDQRGRGVGRALIDGALAAARARGARAVEAMPRCSPEPLRDDELWTGPASALVAAGFVRIDGPDPYPVLRAELDPR